MHYRTFTLPVLLTFLIACRDPCIINRVAETIIGRSREQLRGLRVERALPLVNRHTRQTIGNPAYDALRLSQIVMMDPDAALIREDGTEVGVEDSAAPIHDASGHVIGAVLVFRDVTERRGLADKIASLALYDALTGLANRSLLEDRLRQAIEQAIRDHDKVGLIFMDLDKFKQINDTLGHDMGDLLLQQVAQRISECVREGDTVSRLGGDEFVVIMEDLSEDPRIAASQAKAVAEKILATLNKPYDLGGNIRSSTPSIGVTLFSDHKYGIDQLLKQADLAMYQAKAEGRNTVCFFSADMPHSVAAH